MVMRTCLWARRFTFLVYVILTRRNGISPSPRVVPGCCGVQTTACVAHLSVVNNGLIVFPVCCLQSSNATTDNDEGGSEENYPYTSTPEVESLAGDGGRTTGVIREED